MPGKLSNSAAPQLRYKLPVRVGLVECNISTGRGVEIQADQWRWTRDECPGGPLIQLGIHHIDTLQYLFGPIVRVQGWQQQVLVKADIDDVTCTLLGFESGLLGYLGSAYSSSQACWIKVYGTAAKLTLT